MEFPTPFIESLKGALDAQTCDNLLDSLQGSAPTSIRLNPKKTRKLEVPYTPVSHTHSGFFLTERPNFTADPALHAGAYYPQEANSMWIGEVFEYLKNKYQHSPWLVLDMCAAPGGKTTDVSSRLKQGDILVANEVISSRNNILFENVCKWGDGNTVITKSDAKQFGKIKAAFDVVFCDAPCSGEGMFRKDPNAIKEWSTQNVDLCAQRQQRIVFELWDSIKPGGFLVYSTCTFNRKENEENALLFCEQTGGELVPFQHEKEKNLFSVVDKTYRCLPHLSSGEGLFFCIIQKPSLPKETNKFKNSKSASLLGFSFEGYSLMEKGSNQYLLKSLDLGLLKTINKLPHVVHPGTPVGFNQKGKWKPHPGIAYNIDLNNSLDSELLSDSQVKQYLKREFLAGTQDQMGGAALVWNGHFVGTANRVKNGMNNLLPMEWRVRGDFPPKSILCL